MIQNNRHIPPRYQTIATFTAYGLPKGQPRVRAFARKMGGVHVARVYDPGTAEGWKSCIAMAAKPFIPPAPIAGPVRVEIEFLFARPKYLQKKSSPKGEIPHTAKFDIDNLIKSALDALTMIGVWNDDAQVYSCVADKYYVSMDGFPGARIRISVPAIQDDPQSTSLLILKEG